LGFASQIKQESRHNRTVREQIDVDWTPPIPQADLRQEAADWDAQVASSVFGPNDELGQRASAHERPSIAALIRSVDPCRGRLHRMRVDYFFVDDAASPQDGALDFELLDRLRKSPLPDQPDLQAGIALAQLLSEQFTNYGTDSSHVLTDAGSREAMRSLRAVTDRLKVSFEPPFRDFPGFRAYWGSHGGRGSWAARRTMVSELFEPLLEELERREEDSFQGDLVEPISARKATGWPAVDIEIAELRRHFHGATTPQDYRNLGNDAIAVLEALSKAAYDPTRHLFAGEAEPPIARTKLRLARIVEVDCQTAGGQELASHAKSAIELAQAVKHNPTGSRTQAGIAADAVIQLANMIRRIQEGP
jgi:hypothetical protein